MYPKTHNAGPTDTKSVNRDKVFFYDTMPAAAMEQQQPVIHYAAPKAPGNYQWALLVFLTLVIFMLGLYMSVYPVQNQFDHPAFWIMLIFLVLISLVFVTAAFRKQYQQDLNSSRNYRIKAKAQKF